ncbi:MAG TPA: MaoC/PaaZ C-terminal domain-containing protein [Spirochaetota bacterium]|nr:MaoC/PaaZ C-terminal domain-containing protein [Spirochaetota bacterium]HRZ26097.1 MaoC/PaaZ C-terminal domain-containing protein [Spirochaetota bacterium]HSA13324.1 MaoC/PaaZ C-terminal domain-containing protein [Spirochaetota bacterium]
MTVKTGTILLATLKNIRSENLNRGMIGFAFKRQLAPVLPEQIRLFAEATRDMNPLYFGDRPIAPPFFLSCLIWDHIKQILVHPDLRLNFFRLVHAEQKVSWHAPIYAGEDLCAKIGIKDIVETGAGQMLQISGAVYKADGVMAAEATAGLMIRKKSGSGKRAHTAGAAGTQPAESARLEIKTEKGQNLEYAGASGDTSFIHTSDFLARLTGLPCAIMHGICLLSMACAAFTREFLNGDVTRLTGASARFSRPAIPGDTLTLVCSEGPAGEVPFSAVNESGKTVLSKGTITYARSDI